MSLPQTHVPSTIIYSHNDGTKDVFIKHEELGHGGFAVVYRVTHQGSNKSYAMKVISKDFASTKGKTALEKLKSEMQIQKKLNHPNIVRSKMSFSDGFNYYIVLEYCPGKSVREYLRKSQRGYLSEPETRKILQDVVRGLIYLHNSDIIHHDIKLENFIIGSDGKVKIADFGLSTVLKNEDEKKFTTCGTTNYLSPEIVEKKGHSFEVDIWAIGVAAFVMLTGHPPFDGGKKEETYENIKNCDYQFPSRIAISPEAKSFVKSILKIDPHKRPSAIELLNHPFLTKVDQEKVYLYNPLQSTQKVQSNPFSQSFQKVQSIGPQGSFQKIQPIIQTNSFQKVQTQSAQKVDSIYKFPITQNAAEPIVFTSAMSNMSVRSNTIQSTVQSKNNAFNSSFRSSNVNLSTYRNENENNFKNVDINININNNNNNNNISNNIDLLLSKNNKNNQLNCSNKDFTIPSYFVSKYCFHKDDLGYLLGDGTIGVCFKNGSRIVLDPNEDYVQYYKNYDTFYESINIIKYLEKRVSDDRKDKLQSKISLALRFAKKLKRNKALFEQSVSVDYNKNAALHHVKYFVNKDDSILFKMNNKNIQVNFDDHKKIIIFWNTKKMCLVRSIREKCNLLSLNEVAAMNSNSDELKKFKNAKRMLAVLAQKI